MAPRTVTIGTITLSLEGDVWVMPRSELINPATMTRPGHLLDVDKQPYDFVRCANLTACWCNWRKPANYETLSEAMAVQAAFYEAMHEIETACRKSRETVEDEEDW